LLLYDLLLMVQPGQNTNLFDYIRGKYPPDRDNRHPWEHPQGMWFPTLNEGSYIVVFRKDMEPAQVDTLVKKLSQNHGIHPRHIYKFAMKGFAATLNDSQLAKVILLEEVVYFEGDGQVTYYAKSHHKYGARLPKEPTVGGSNNSQATAVLSPQVEGLNRVKVALTGVPRKKVDSTEQTRCHPEEMVNCVVSPCQMAKCERYPEAICQDNYCGGCNTDFLLNGEKVSCDPSGSGEVVVFSKYLPYIQEEQWLKTLPPQGSFIIGADKLEETASFLREYGYDVTLLKSSKSLQEL
jgi:hypothetical protein